MSAEQRPSPQSVIGLTLLHQVLVSFAAATFPVLLPELVARIGLHGSAAGIYAITLYIGGVTSALLCMHLFAAFGAAMSSALGVILGAAAVLGILGTSMPVIVASALVLGLGYGPTTPASSYMLSQLVNRSRANFIYSLRQTGAPIGMLLAGLLVPVLVAAFEWRGAVIVVAAVTGLLAVATIGQTVRADRHFGRPAAPSFHLFGPLREILAIPSLRRLVTASSLYAAIMSTVNAYVPFAVAELAGASLAGAGFAAACGQLGSVIGRLGWGAAADYVGSARPVLVGLGVAMASTLALLALTTPAVPFVLVVLLCGVLGAVGGGWTGVVLAEVARVSPPGRVGSSTAGLMVCNYLGVFVGPPIVAGVLALTGNLRVALVTVSLMGFVGALAALSAYRRGRAIH